MQLSQVHFVPHACLRFDAMLDHEDSVPVEAEMLTFLDSSTLVNASLQSPSFCRRDAVCRVITLDQRTV